MSDDYEQQLKELKEDEFVIEAIVKTRRVGKKLQYLCKWKDFNESENTWEPIENLHRCPELLAAFNANSKRSPAIKRKRQSPIEEDALWEPSQAKAKGNGRRNSRAQVNSCKSSNIDMDDSDGVVAYKNRRLASRKTPLVQRDPNLSKRAN